MEFLNTIAALIKEYGVGATGWIVLLAAIALIAGKGGKLAFQNVASLLSMSSEMRTQALKELRLANETIADLRQSLTEADENMRREREQHDDAVRRLRNQMSQLDSRIVQLSHDLQVAQGAFQASDLPRR